MLKDFFRYRTFFYLLIAALLLKLLSLQPAWVEDGYTYGAYFVLSKLMRLLTGWLPFSIGDLLYGAAGIRLGLFILMCVKKVRAKALKRFWYQVFYNAICTLLFIFILFKALWGLNYNRQGIAHQLNLQVQPYSLADAMQLAETLQTRLNTLAASVDSVKRNGLNTNRNLFQKAIAVYGEAEKTYAFLQYTAPSIKASLYSGVGHYFGFTGYYNPFSSEAQIKTSIPVFLKPFVVTHEIAHQLGYAKENEANFVAFLSSRQSADRDFLYSVYYNLYHYAVREVNSRDTIAAMSFRKRLHPQVLRDNEELKAYFISTQNRIEPLVTRFYDQFLKWNNQKAGVQTYNQVVALLIAYGKKFGWAAI